jgi:hypothetical protein
MSEEFSLDEVLARVNPVPASDVAHLVTESDTNALLEDLRERRAQSRWRTNWRKLLARFGLMVLILVGSVGATAVAIDLLRGTSSNASSVACYYQAPGTWEGVNITSSNAPVRECEAFWSAHHRPISGMKFQACVLQSGIVGVFGGDGRTNPCAARHLPVFTRYSSPNLVHFEASIIVALQKEKCPSAQNVDNLVRRTLHEDGIRGWRVDNELVYSPSNTCATFAYAETLPPQIAITAKYPRVTGPAPLGTAVSLAQWRRWAALQRRAFLATDWKRDLNTSLCHVVKDWVKSSRSNGMFGAPKGSATNSVSVKGTCKQ